ncbi:hypothetical protein SLJ66_001964 [Escherichia coli]|nr:hypothetical protein [Escherichia coli]
MNKPIEIKIGRYSIDVPKLVFGVLVVSMCFGIQNIIDRQSKLLVDLQSENSTLSRRITASDIKRSEAERQLAANNAQTATPGIVIISPDGASVQHVEPKRSYTTLQRDVAF